MKETTVLDTSGAEASAVPTTVLGKRGLAQAAPASAVERNCRTPNISDPPLKVQRLHEESVLPRRGSALSAGYDIAAGEASVVPARGKAIVKTGLKMAIPEGYYGRVAPRSGLAVKKFIDTGAGVIDADYRGELGVVLFNFSDQDFSVEPGDRIAQLLIEKISMGNVIEVSSLDETERGAGGFGSTGVKA